MYRCMEVPMHAWYMEIVVEAHVHNSTCSSSDKRM